MIVIGITGSLGTGKSTVARMFTRLGTGLINVDQIVHKHLTPSGKAYAPVVHAFGKDILDRKKINRRELAEIVFRDPRKLKILTSIIHPIVLKDVQAQIQVLKQNKKNRMIVIETPLLFEAGWHTWMDYTIVVKSSQALQIRRVMAERSSTRADILRRIRSQMSMRQKINMADLVIDNRKTLRETQKQVHVIAQRLLTRAH